MMPAELELALAAELSGYTPAAIAQAAAALSQRYREPRAGSRLRGRTDVAAYLAYRLPATYAATAAALSVAAAMQPSFAPHSLVDAGSGPGTAAWAALSTWPSLAECILLERDGDMIAAGQRLAGASSRAALRGARWEQRDLTATRTYPAGELVIAAYVLGELAPAQRAVLVQNLWQGCSGTLVLVEPGTTAGYLAVQSARLALVRAGAHTTAPCPHDRRCPLMIAVEANVASNGSSDQGGTRSPSGPRWCHFRERLDRSRTHRLAKRAERGYEDEPYAYAVLSRHAALPISARVVGAPRIGHGHVELDLCTPEGLHDDVIGKREGDTYRVARRLQWGDTLWAPAKPDPAG